MSGINNPITSGGGTPSGPAGGDLTGNYPSPAVSGIRGQEVSPDTPLDGFVLIHDGTRYVPSGIILGGGAPAGPAGGDLSGSYPNPTVSGIQNVEVSATTPLDGHILIHDGTRYVPSGLVLGGGGGGGVADSGGIIAETYTAIDLTATGIHQIYSVPVGKKAAIYGAIFTCESASAISGDASVSIGANDDSYDSIIADQLLVQFRNADDGYKIIDFGKFIQASGDVKIRVNSIADGTELDAKVFLVGFTRDI